MTPDDVLKNVNSELEKDRSVAQMSEETLLAVRELGRQRDESIEACVRKDREIAELKKTAMEAEKRISTAELARRKAEAKAKDSEWVAGELGKFVRDVALGLHEGHEVAAARRVYDLNSGSLTIRRIMADEHDSVKSALDAFMSEHDGKEVDISACWDFLAWCWKPSRSSRP